MCGFFLLYGFFHDFSNFLLIIMEMVARKEGIGCGLDAAAIQKTLEEGLDILVRQQSDFNCVFDGLDVLRQKCVFRLLQFEMQRHNWLTEFR